MYKYLSSLVCAPSHLSTHFTSSDNDEPETITLLIIVFLPQFHPQYIKFTALYALVNSLRPSDAYIRR